MLAEIENAVITRIKQKAPAIPHVDSVKTGIAQVAKMAFTVAILEGSAEAMAQDAKQLVNISVWVVFKNLKSDEDRRKGAFPVVEAIAQFLFKQDLGLKITRLRYTGFKDVTDSEERAACNAVYQLDFKTSYLVTQLEEEETQELLSVGLKYLLEGMESPAATDVVILKTEEELTNGI